MISMADASRALHGAYRLALFDKTGHTFFDISVTGFWRSFSAVFLVAPFFLVLLNARYNAGLIEDASFARYIGLEFSVYILSWLFFPFIMEQLSKSIGCRDRFIAFIVAYNWAMVPQYVIFISVISLGLIGIIPSDMSESLTLVLLIWTFIYAGFIAKTALDIPLITTMGIVFLDFLLGLTLDIALTG